MLGAEPSKALEHLCESTSRECWAAARTRLMAKLVILKVPQDALSRVRYLANKSDQEAQHWLKVDFGRTTHHSSRASYATRNFAR
jgi:hypothetical protein